MKPKYSKEESELIELMVDEHIEKKKHFIEPEYNRD